MERGWGRTQMDNVQVLMQTSKPRGGRDDDETFRVGPFEDDLAGRATDPACDGCQHRVQGATGVISDRPFVQF